MSKIKIQGDSGGSGTYTIVSPDTDATNTVTLPDNSGTLVTSSQSIVPSQDAQFDLGSATNRWKDIHVSGNTINIGGIAIKASASGIVLPELTIGSGTNTVKLAATTDGKLEQTGTSSTGSTIASAAIPQVLNDLSDVDMTVEPTNNQVLGYSILQSGTISTVTIPSQISTTGKHLTVDNFNQTVTTRPAGSYSGVTGTSNGTGTVGTFDITIGLTDTSDGVQSGVITAAPYNRDTDFGHSRRPNFATSGTHNTSFTILSTGGMVVNGAAPGLQMAYRTISPQHYSTTGSGTGATFSMAIWPFDGAGNAKNSANYDTATNGYGPYQMFLWVKDQEDLSSGTSGDPSRVFPDTYQFGGSGYAAGDTITIYGSANHPNGSLASGLPAHGSSFDQSQDVIFTITANGVYSDGSLVSNVTVVSQGSGHSVGDTISIPDSSLGATGVANFEMKVATIEERTAGTYSGVTGTSSNSSSTVGTFDIVVDSSGDMTSATPITFGVGHLIGDVITISDSVLGSGGAPDGFVQVATIDNTVSWSGKDSIRNFSDFTDVDTVTTPPTDTQILAWDDTKWVPSHNPATRVVATTTEMVALTGLQAGDKALVTGLNRIYVYTGTSASSAASGSHTWRHAVSGWYAIADITMSNAKPAAVTGISPTYTLNDIGESLILTTAAVDPEQMPLTWSYAVTAGTKTDDTTIVQRDITTPTDTSNVFTITPGIYPWDTSSFSITFSVADDSLDTTDAIGAFTLTIILPDWKDNSNWYTEVSNTDFNAADAASMDGNNAIYFGNSVDIDDDSDTVIVSDPRWARPTQAPGQTSGVQKVGAIHIYNKNTTAGYSTWTKNNQILVDPIDAVTDSLVSDASGGHGGFAGDVGTELWDITSTGYKIALSGNSENIAAIYGSGANSRVPTFKLDGGTSTYISGDSLYPVDVPIPAGNSGMVKGTSNFVASRQACLTMSKDGNVCIVGYPLEGQTGKTWTYADQRSSEVQNLSSTLPAFSIGDAIPPAGGIVSDFFEYSFVAKNQSNIDFPVDNDFCNFGAVYIYEKTSTGTNLNTPLWNSENSEWGLTMKLTGIDIVDNLGSSVDLSADGTIAIASAPRGSSAPYNSPANPKDRAGGYVTIWDSTTVAGSWTNVGTLRSPTNVIDTSGVPFGQHKYLDTFGPPDTLRTAGTYSNVTGTSSGSGVVGFFNITVGSSGDVSNVEVATLGTGHAVGDTITIVDADLGAGGAADFTFNVTTDTGLTGLHTRSNLGRNSISISGDGKTIAVGDDGATTELITDTGVYGTDIAPHSHAFDGITKGHPYPAGAVHIYKNISDTWTYIETILMPNGVSREAFGNGVDLNHNGMLLTIGAPFETTLGLHPTQDPSVQTGIPKTKSGAVYTYELSGASATVAGNWKQTNRLIIPLLENTVDQGNAYMGRPKISSEGKTIVAGHRNAGPEVGGRVEFWKEGEVNGMGEITGLNETYSLNTTGVSTEIVVSVDDPQSNDIWWSFAVSNIKNNSMNNFIHNGGAGWLVASVDPANPVQSLRVPGTYTIQGTNSGRGRAPLETVIVATDGTIASHTIPPVSLTSTHTIHSSGLVVGETVTFTDAQLGGGGAPDFVYTVSELGSAIPGGTYNNIPMHSTSGSGSGATFNITVGQNGNITDVQVVDIGTGNAEGDRIRVLKTEFDSTQVNMTEFGSNYQDFFMDFGMIGSAGTRTVSEERHTTPFGFSAATDDINQYDRTISPTEWKPITAPSTDSAIVRRLYGNTNRPRSFEHSSGVNVGSSTPHLTDYPYVAYNTAASLTNPTGTGPENTFIITPSTDINLSVSFDLTITATDSVNVKTATTKITLNLN